METYPILVGKIKGTTTNHEVVIVALVVVEEALGTVNTTSTILTYQSGAHIAITEQNKILV